MIEDTLLLTSTIGTAGFQMVGKANRSEIARKLAYLLLSRILKHQFALLSPSFSPGEEARRLVEAPPGRHFFSLWRLSRNIPQTGTYGGNNITSSSGSKGFDVFRSFFSPPLSTLTQTTSILLSVAKVTTANKVSERTSEYTTQLVELASHSSAAFCHSSSSFPLRRLQFRFTLLPPSFTSE